MRASQHLDHLLVEFDHHLLFSIFNGSDFLKLSILINFIKDHNSLWSILMTKDIFSSSLFLSKKFKRLIEFVNVFAKLDSFLMILKIDFGRLLFQIQFILFLYILFGLVAHFFYLLVDDPFLILFTLLLLLCNHFICFLSPFFQFITILFLQFSLIIIQLFQLLNV